MALLDVFSVVFDADADKLKKGAGEAEEVLEETKHQIIDTDAAAESMGESFLDAIGSAKGAIAGLLSVGAVTAAVVAQAAVTDQLGKFSQTLGENIEDVGAWSEAVARSGGSAEGFQGSIKTLKDNLTELSLTGSGPAAEVLARLGISATDAAGNMKPMFDLLPELAGSFEGLTEAESLNLGEKLGLDQSTILLLQQGQQSVDDLVARQRSLGVATAEDSEIAAKFNDAWDDLTQIFAHVTRTIGAYVLPALTGILKGVEKLIFFFKEHEGFAIGFFGSIAAVIAYTYLPAITAAAIATAVTIAPFVAIGAAVAAAAAAIGVLVDDIYTFIEGGDSLTGRVLKNLIDGFNDFKESVLDTWESVKGFFDFFGDDSDMVVKATKNAQLAIESAQQNPLAGQTAQALAATTNSLNRNTTVSVGAVNVDAKGGDSAEISANVGSALREEMQKTLSNYDDTVAM